MGKEESR